MKYEELKEYLIERGFDDADIFAPPTDCAPAAIGVSEDGRVVYDYEKMVKWFVKGGMSLEDVDEFIEINTLRGLPSMGEKRPIIMYKLD
ncbi:MAG: hypothetical protein J6T22_09280 [Bacteroidales bacterium]|nr:hypothetical protein [Bacteroidales bacterium]MBO7617385.1 hypothetical protein [Bacteroidales bacterium]